MPVPPAAPPAPPAPPGAPQGPPTWGQPTYGVPQYGTPQPGAPLGYAAPPAPAPVQPKKSRAGLIIGLVVLAALVIGGIVGVALFALGGSGELELTLDTCEIAADGTLTASGVVVGPNGTGVQIDVEFVDTETGARVDDAATSVDLSFGSSGNPWTVTGTAGDEVQQVTCNATADD
jgi:hypothetical protein